MPTTKMQYWSDFMLAIQQRGGEVRTGSEDYPWKDDSIVATVILPNGEQYDLLYSIWRAGDALSMDSRIANLFFKYESRWNDV